MSRSHKVALEQLGRQHRRPHHESRCILGNAQCCPLLRRVGTVINLVAAIDALVALWFSELACGGNPTPTRVLHQLRV
jgi:hypothetical protein